MQRLRRWVERLGGLRQPEVAQVDAAVIVEQDIARSQVAVNHALTVHIAQPAGDLRKQVNHVLQRQRRVTQPVCQRAVLDQAHGEIGGAAFNAVAVDRQDVDVLQHGDHFRFAGELLEEITVVFGLKINDFERDVPGY